MCAAAPTPLRVIDSDGSTSFFLFLYRRAESCTRHLTLTTPIIALTLQFFSLQIILFTDCDCCMLLFLLLAGAGAVPLRFYIYNPLLGLDSALERYSFPLAPADISGV